MIRCEVHMPHAHCPKCGASWTWRHPIYDALKDRLYITCLCGFTIRYKPLDAKPDAEVKP